MDPRKKDKLNSNFRLFKGIFSALGGLLLLVLPIKTLSNAITDSSQAIRNKLFHYPLICVGYLGFMIAAIIAFIKALFLGEVVSFLLFVVFLALAIVLSKVMEQVRAELTFYCDICNTRCDHTIGFTNTGSETFTKTETHIVGSHYELNIKDDQLIANKVYDKEKRQVGSTKIYTGSLCATLTCPSCGKKEEIKIKHSTASANVSDSEAKKVIIDAIIARNKSKDFAKIK